MSTIYEIRRDNLRIIINQRGATSVALACGYKGPSYISQMAGKTPTRPITEDNARKFEKGLGLEPYWLDTPRDAFGNPAPRNPTPPASVVPTAEKRPGLFQIDVDRFSLVADMVKASAVTHGKSLTSERFKIIAAMAYEAFQYEGEALEQYVDNLVSIAP